MPATAPTRPLPERALEVLRRAGNPFRNYFARNPDDEVCGRYHVAELFARQREQLLGVVDLYRYDPTMHSEVVPVLGNKGAGKTHLLHSIKHGSEDAWQLLVTPGTGAQADTPSHRRYARGFLLEASTIEWFFAGYIDRADRSDWRFAPLHADELDGVAPACVILAECDPLVDEGLAYVDRLRLAGVAVELELARGMTHDFIKMGRALDEAGIALDFAGAALQRAFEP